MPLLYILYKLYIHYTQYMQYVLCILYIVYTLYIFYILCIMYIQYIRTEERKSATFGLWENREKMDFDDGATRGTAPTPQKDGTFHNQMVPRTNPGWYMWAGVSGAICSF